MNDFQLGDIVVVNLVGVCEDAVCTLTVEAGATLVASGGGAEELLLVLAGEAQNAVDVSLVVVQQGLLATCTTDTAVTALTTSNLHSGAVTSVGLQNGVVGDGGLSVATSCCGCVCTSRQNGLNRGVTQAGGGSVDCLGVVERAICGHVVGTGLGTDTRTATATCNSNRGAINNQSGGATAGTTVEVTLHIGRHGRDSFNTSLSVCGNGLFVDVTTVTVALTTGCGAGLPNSRTVNAGLGRQVSYTTGSCDQLDDLACLDGDFTGHESTRTASNLSGAATCATSDLEAKLVDIRRDGELDGVLSTGGLTGNVELGSRRVLALSGRCESGNCSRCCNNRSSPCCASNNLAARNVSRHVCPSRVMSF